MPGHEPKPEGLLQLMHGRGGGSDTSSAWWATELSRVGGGQEGGKDEGGGGGGAPHSMPRIMARSTGTGTGHLPVPRRVGWAGAMAPAEGGGTSPDGCTPRAGAARQETAEQAEVRVAMERLRSQLGESEKELKTITAENASFFSRVRAASNAIGAVGEMVTRPFSRDGRGAGGGAAPAKSADFAPAAGELSVEWTKVVAL